MSQIFSVLVENKAGVLSKVANLFARRGHNIDSLAVGETQLPELSRITVMVNISEESVQQVIRQLYKLQDVLMVKRLLPGDHFSRQLVLIKVQADASQRGELIQLASVFRGHIVDVSQSTVTVEVSGAEEKVNALQNMLEPYKILELVRTGLVAIERGERSLNVESLYNNSDQ